MNCIEAVTAVEFRVLGALEAVGEGCLLPLGRPKQQALLAALLLDANRVVSVDRLIEELWTDEPPASARHSVEVYVSGLRKALGPDRIRTVAPGYTAAVEPHELDLVRFERLVQKGRRALVAGRAGVARNSLGDALALWRGPPLDGITAGRHTEAAIARLEDLRLDALEARIDADLALGRHDELVTELEGLVAERPLREGLRSRLMLTLYRCGRQADALASYQSARRMLVDEVGIEPSRGLQELERAILNQDPSLEPEPSSTHESYAPLPIAAASFVGRRDELVALSDLLKRSDVRLVTLTGAGGIGKTRLAIEAVRGVEADRAHGAAFVALAAVRELDDVPRAIADSLGVREPEGTSLEEAVKSHLRDKDLILLVDNFEHVLGAATLVSELLASCPELTVLVTSRAPLRLYGEHEVAVPPLGLADLGAANGRPSEAAELFLHRARAARAGTADPNETGPVVEEICVRLDGMPLAIELAAARVKVLSPKALLARMENRLRLLTGGPRDVPARHRTLRAAIEWSYDLLGLEERRLFARLTVFAGGFSLEAAEAVCDASLEQVAVLHDNGLLRADPNCRFGMLETIREYGSEQLDQSGELAELRERHGEFFVALAERAEPELRGPNQLEWLDRLDDEQANVWAAFDWALEVGRPELSLRLSASLWRYWEARGSIVQARAKMASALAHPAAVDPKARARALFSSGRIALRQGDLAHAVTAFEAAEALFREVGDEGGTALCLAGRGWIAHSVGPTSEAVALCREAVAVARRSREEWVIGDALNNLGVALRADGDEAGSRAALEKSLALRQAIGELEGVTATLNGLALLAIANDDVDEAESLFRTAFSASEGRRDLFYDAAHDVVLGYLAFARSDLDRAETLALSALESSRRNGYMQFAAYALEVLAGVAASEGRADDAAILVGAALATAEGLGRSYPRCAEGRSPGVAYDWEARAVKSVLAQSRLQAGAEAWEAAVDEGRSLDPDRASEYALRSASRNRAVRVA